MGVPVVKFNIDEVAAHFGVSKRTLSEKARAEAERKTAEKMAYNRLINERDWVANGYEPLPNSDGSLSSVSFLKSLNMWPPKGAQRLQNDQDHEQS